MLQFEVQVVTVYSESLKEFCECSSVIVACGYKKLFFDCQMTYLIAGSGICNGYKFFGMCRNRLELKI